MSSDAWEHVALAAIALLGSLFAARKVRKDLDVHVDTIHDKLDKVAPKSQDRT